MKKKTKEKLKPKKVPPFELYPQEYDYFFTDKKNNWKGCNLYRVKLDRPYKTFYNPNCCDFVALDRYDDDMRKMFKEADRAMWDSALKMAWMFDRYNYIKKGGKKNKKDLNKAEEFDKKAFSAYCRIFVGAEVSLYYNKMAIKVVDSYVREIDPTFMKEGNPFEQSVPFPFKNILMCHMAAVIDMDERMDLLRHADENNFKYNRFLDFVANWVGCYTEKHGKKYQMQIKKNDLMGGVVNLEIMFDDESDELYEL